MIDYTQVLLIGGAVGAILLTFVIPLIFLSRKTRIARFFKKQKDVRFQLVENIIRNPSSLPNDLSYTEMVAILTTILARETVSDGFSAAQRFSTMGWANKFNDEFLDQFYIVARKLASQQWNRDSSDLLRLGQMIAKAHNLPYWERQFAESVARLNAQRVEGDLPTRQK